MRTTPHPLAAMTLVLILGASAVQPALAQDGVQPARAVDTSPPTGAEIAAAARTATLDVANAGTATLLGKPFKFTPAHARKNVSPDEGAFIGVLENGAAGDETGLPAGRYNIFVAQLNGAWKAYAESGGRVVREAVRVKTRPAAGATKPGFEEKGWCFWHRVYFSKTGYINIWSCW